MVTVKVKIINVIAKIINVIANIINVIDEFCNTLIFFVILRKNPLKDRKTIIH